MLEDLELNLKLREAIAQAEMEVDAADLWELDL